MPDETAVKQWLIKWGTPLLIALLGGLAREAQDHREGRPFCFWHFMARLTIAAFAGLLAALLSSEYEMSAQWTGVLAGIAGYSGVEAIDCAKRFVQGRMGVGK